MLTHIAITLCSVVAAVETFGGLTFAQTDRRLEHPQSKIERPKDLSDVLRNTKTIIDSGSLLRPTFYTDATLLKFSGGEAVHWSESTNTEKSGAIAGLDAIVGRTMFYGKWLDGMDLAFVWRLDEGGRPHGAILLSVFGSTSTNFETVVAIFGSEWRPSEPILPSHPLGRGPITAPHGLDRITYSYRSSGIVGSVEFRFDEDAKLEEMAARLKAQP
jgi:hypothetical protein